MAVNYLHHINNDKMHIMQHFMRTPFFSIELYILIEKVYSDKYTKDYVYKGSLGDRFFVLQF